MGSKRRNTRKFPKRGSLTDVDLDGAAQEISTTENSNGTFQAGSTVTPRSPNSARLTRKPSP